MTPITPGTMIEPGVTMYWFGADLYYANAGYFVEQALRLVNESPAPVRWLIVDAEAITGMDFSAGRALIDLQQDLASKGVALALTRVEASLRADLDRQQVTDAIGAHRIFRSRKLSLAACQSSTASP